jgi:hypothetical protein
MPTCRDFEPARVFFKILIVVNGRLQRHFVCFIIFNQSSKLMSGPHGKQPSRPGSAVKIIANSADERSKSK